MVTFAFAKEDEVWRRECSCVTPTILCWLKQILQRGKHTKNFLTISLYQIVQHAPLLESLYGHWNWCRSGEREIRSLFTTLLRIPVGAQPPLFSEFVDFFLMSKAIGKAYGLFFIPGKLLTWLIAFECIRIMRLVRAAEATTNGNFCCWYDPLPVRPINVWFHVIIIMYTHPPWDLWYINLHQVKTVWSFYCGIPIIPFLIDNLFMSFHYLG